MCCVITQTVTQTVCEGVAGLGSSPEGKSANPKNGRTFRKGMTNGLNGKLVASCSLEWNSSMVSVEF